MFVFCCKQISGSLTWNHGRVFFIITVGHENADGQQVLFLFGTVRPTFHNNNDDNNIVNYAPAKSPSISFYRYFIITTRNSVLFFVLRISFAFENVLAFNFTDGKIFRTLRYICTICHGVWNPKARLGVWRTVQKFHTRPENKRYGKKTEGKKLLTKLYEKIKFV